MASLYKHTLIFEGAGHGWTETMYFERPTDDVDGALAWVSVIKQKRAPLLGAQFSIKGERVALIKDAAGNKVTRRAAPAKFFLQGNQQHQGEDTGTSLQVLMQSSDKSHNKLTFLGGPWAEIFPFANSYTPAAGGWQTFFGAWAAALIDRQMGWMSQTVVESRKITGYVFDPLTGRTEYTLGLPGMTWDVDLPPTRVNVEFPAVKSPLDGVQIVVPSMATKCKTAGPRPAPAFAIEGTMKRYAFGFVNLATLNQQGQPGTITGQNPVSRKRGRPLSVSRGRSPAKVRW